MPGINKKLLAAEVALPPVFDKWIRDDIIREKKAYYIDTTPFRENGKLKRDNFEPERFIKDPIDIENCEEAIKNKFKFFQIFYQQCQSISLKYPEIDLPTF